jgi:CDP-diacylglycerol--glycerol-3-phosphate 3-phosphatidyltransferase
MAMLNLRVRPALGQLVDPVAGALLRLRVSPDALTIAGTLGVVVGSLVLFPRGYFLAGTVIVTVFVLTDLLDGTMARKLGTASPFGAWLDSTCDRVGDAAIFCGLILWFTGAGDDRLLAALALFCLVAGSVVSYAKARAEGLGLRCDVGLAERAERVILVLVTTFLAGLGLDVAFDVGLWLLAAVTAVTVVQRLVEVRRQAAIA